MFSTKGYRLRMTLIGAALISLLVTASSAAERNLAGRRSYSILDRFKQAVTHVTLTDDQKTKVDKIFQDASAQADELARHTADPSRAERAQVLIDFAHQLHQQLGQVLNTGQMETLQLYLGPGPSSRPTADDFAGGNAIWKNLPKALAKLDLTDSQRQQVNDLMETSRQKMTDIRAQTANGASVQSQMQQLRQDTKTKLESILTPDQMQTTLQTLQQLRENQSGPTTQPRKQTAASVDLDQTAATGAQASPKTSLHVGDPIPDMKIAELNGSSFIPANYKGHILVLEFGSISCPAFREQVQAMEKLRMDESQRAFFLMVYTREASPVTDKDAQPSSGQNISIPEATTLEARKLQAYKTQQTLQISTIMAVDSMDDAVSNAFGTFPSGAVVIGKDGKIAALQHSSSLDELRVAIDKAYETPDSSDH